MLWNNWKMDNYISRILEDRFATREFKGKARNVMDLALEGYRGTEHKASPQMDRQFKKNAICQVKTFMFAGHDTVSGTLAYAFHLLSKSPDKMAKIREEHDRVFGPNPDDAEELIRSKPVLLNKLEYTLAVMKETLRLYPPASTMREGHKGYAKFGKSRIFSANALQSLCPRLEDWKVLAH
jgi:cytochrome P450